MKRIENMIGNAEDKILRNLGWGMALLVTAVFAGCGSGGGNAILGDPIVSVIGVPPPATVGGQPVVLTGTPSVIITGASSVVVAGVSGVIAPGEICPVAATTIPTVTASDPNNGYQFATTSTNGVAGGGKSITASFSLAMDPATINSANFTLTPLGGVGLVPASISYNAFTNVATLKTSAALLANQSYTAFIYPSVTSTTGVVSPAVTSTTGITPSCTYKWTFKTAAVASAGLAPVDLGTATPFAIASAAGLTNTATVPLSHINGDVVLDPTATCNAVTVDAAGGFGLCGGMAPTLTGTVISPLYNAGITSVSIMADLKTAYNSILPANLPGATVLGCGTIGSNGGAGALVGCAGNATLPPGVYISATSSSIGVTGTLTLDGQGDSNARFVFQAPSTLTTAAGAIGAPGSQIVLINGAKASNIWWQVGSSATIGTYAIFNGNILADTSITLGTSSTSCGRLLAGAITASGAFTFDTNIVSVPGNASAPAGCK
jgi:hypothetical protein